MPFRFPMPHHKMSMSLPVFLAVLIGGILLSARAEDRLTEFEAHEIERAAQETQRLLQTRPATWTAKIRASGNMKGDYFVQCFQETNHLFWALGERINGKKFPSLLIEQSNGEWKVLERTGT